jgi:nucleotide-binding universal stress UspA family protein
MLEWRKMGCGIDFSEHSRLAMLKACELARRLDGDLELVHVHVPPVPVGDVVVTPADLGAAALAEIEKRMAMWSDEAARLVGRPVRFTVVPGDAAAEIARLAREHGLDLLVLGTEGRRGLKRLLLGSVAGRVVRDAPCAVLIVRREPVGAEARKQAEAR